MLRSAPTPEAPIDGDDAEDRRLLLCVSTRDRAAFVALFRRYRPRVHRFLSRLVTRSDELEELFNDVMLAVWTQAPNFAGRSKVSTWVFGIAYRKALKCLERNHRNLEDPCEEPPEGVASSSPEADMESGQLQALVHQAIGQLSAEQRAVVTLTFYHGYSYAEIARIVGCPENTVKTRMFYAREKLRELLSGFQAGGNGVRSHGEAI